MKKNALGTAVKTWYRLVKTYIQTRIAGQQMFPPGLATKALIRLNAFFRSENARRTALPFFGDF